MIVDPLKKPTIVFDHNGKGLATLACFQSCAMQSCKLSICWLKILLDGISSKKIRIALLGFDQRAIVLLRLLLQPILLPCFADARDLHYVHRRGRPRYHIPGRARPAILSGHGQLCHHLRFRQWLRSSQQSPAGIVLASSSLSTIVVIVIIAFIKEKEPPPNRCHRQERVRY